MIKEFIDNVFEVANNMWIIICISLAIFATYYSIKSEIASNLSTFIKDAAYNTNLTGPQKMDLVLSWVKNIIPRLFKVLFSDKVLRQMAQNIYDDMKAYKKLYIKNELGVSEDQLEDIIESVDDPKYE